MDGILKGVIVAVHHCMYEYSDSSNSTGVLGGYCYACSPNLKRSFTGSKKMLIYHYLSGEGSLYD